MEAKAILYTHKHVDFDAIASVILLKQFLKRNDISVATDFISTYEKIEPPSLAEAHLYFLDITPNSPPENATILDHHNEKDISSEETATSKTYSYLYDRFPREREELSLWQDIVKESKIQDYAKDLKDQSSSVKLRDVLRAYRALRLNDQEILDRFEEIILGIVELARKRRDSSRLFKELKGQIEEVNGYKIAYYEGEGVNEYLFIEERCDFILYKQGFNMGIIRNALIYQPSLLTLKPYIEERVGDEISQWFFHPGGFFVGRGGKTHPIEEPSVLSFDEFISIVKKWLNTIERKV